MALADRLHGALGDDVRPREAAEDVHQHGLHVRVVADDLQRRDDRLRVVRRADVEEVRGVATGVLDRVEGGHREPRAVHQAADVAVQLHVVLDARVVRLQLLLRLLRAVAERGEVLLAVVGVVVDGELRVGGQHAAILRQHQRVDLHHRRVGLEERLREVADERRGAVQVLAAEADRERQLTALVRLEAACRVDACLVDRAGVGCRDLFDVHAALGAGDDHRPAGRVVDGDGEVDLLVDVDRFLDKDGVHRQALRARLVGDHRHPDDLRRDLLRLGGVVGDLDAAGLAARAGVRLRLDDDLAAQLLRDGLGLVRGGSDAALRDRHAEAREDLFCLVLVEFHDASIRMDSVHAPVEGRALRGALHGVRVRWQAARRDPRDGSTGGVGG